MVALTSDQIVAGYNGAWLLFAATIGVYFTIASIRRIRRRQYDDVTRIMAGVALVCVGSVVHRGFWMVWRWLRSIGADDIAARFPDWAVPIGGLAAAVICIGYAFHGYPVTKNLFGRFWLLAATAFLSIGFFGGAYAHKLLGLLF